MKSEKITLVHVIGGLVGGGRERRMVELIKGLDADNKYEQYVIAFKTQVDYPDIYKTNAKIIFIESNLRLRAIKELVCTINRLHPSILHLWTEIHYVLCTVSLLKPFMSYKLIVGFIADGNIVKNTLSKIANKLAFFMADSIVSNSKAGVIAKCAPVRKSRVIYNGFSYTRFGNFKNFREVSLKRELKLNTQYVIPMMARFNLAKDWDTFLGIAEYVGKCRSDVTFLAIGKGELQDHYISEARKRGIDNVEFMGFRNDIDKILFCSDICLLCTNEEVHAEGVSNSIMESMAAGKPVVATYGGGTPEIISDGIDGFIIPPHDVNAGVKIILQLLSHPEDMMAIGKNAKETIERRFLLDNMVENYEKLYYCLTNKNCIAK